MHKNGTPPKKLWLRSAIAVGVTFVGLGALASSALFTDAGTVSSNAFTDGTVVLGLTPVTTALTAANMAPGDTSYGTIKVTNNGTLPMRYAATSVATNADAKGLAAQAQMTINVGATTCDAAGFASGSMAPTYPTGTDLIMAKVADPTSMQAGDVITVTEGTGLPVTHRVAERVVLPSGVTYRMKGDANRTADPVLVSADKVIGKIDRAVPVWAEMAIWIERTNMRFIVFGLPLVWLLAIEFTSFLKEWKGRTRADSEQTTAGGSAGSGSGDAGR